MEPNRPIAEQHIDAVGRSPNAGRWITRELEPADLFLLDIQELQKLELDSVLSADPAFLAENPSCTVIDKEAGTILCCMGYVERPPNCALCWVLLSSFVGPKNLFILLRIIAKYLESIPVRRLEAQVDYNFKSWSRVMQKLGFICEAPILHDYWGEGRNVTLYARIK